MSQICKDLLWKVILHSLICLFTMNSNIFRMFNVIFYSFSYFFFISRAY